tara:strand:+ start:682 stop:909 length:228 start_codon:yes stop_codon:yes gene_type:complete
MYGFGNTLDLAMDDVLPRIPYSVENPKKHYSAFTIEELDMGEYGWRVEVKYSLRDDTSIRERVVVKELAPGEIDL